MKLNLIRSVLFLAIVLTSCDFGGVKSPDADEIITSGNDTIKTILNDGLTNGDSDQPAYALLNDTILGQPNNMVLQKDNGLRIEWTEKNNDLIKLNDVVMVNYKARVAGGEQYDSNEEIGEPVPLKSNIGMMVKGWEEGLLTMNIGDVGRILIPAALGYGENGIPDLVPSNADLVVDIEIVSRIEPIELDEGVKVYTWKKNKNGVYPKKDQYVTFDYFAYTTGEEGKLYDNSFKNREPFSFKLEDDNVVDGLHQGFSAIRADENAFIEIPYKLAYGSKGLVDLVPKNTNIVYDVRVIRFED